MRLRIILIAVLTLLLSMATFGQGSIAEVRLGDTLPATCRPASRNIFFYKTGSDAGFYVCLTVDTWTSITSSGIGDTVSTASSSVDSEAAVFSGTSGKQIKRMTGTGIAFLTSGVLSAATTIGNAYTLNIKDSLFTLQDDSDATKLAKFQIAGFTTGNTRTFTLPDATDTVAVLGQAQTFSALDTFSAGVALPRTSTAPGTTGAQTIAKQSFSVNFAASGTSLVVTNSLAVTTSIVVCTVNTVDATMKTVVAVPTSGAITLTSNAAATGETRVSCLLNN